MQLIGMLDSPFVRRVAISLHQLQIPFEQRSISVFRQIDVFRTINPVVKAPSLVCDDGTVLMDSSLILDYVETLAGHSLLPQALPARQRALRVIGLALVAAEKSVQLYYESQLRPADKQHAPWQARVGEQLCAAWQLLEAELALAYPDVLALDQAGISSAVAWRFAREVLPPTQVDWAAYPLLARWSAQAETLPAFLAAPFDA